MIDLLPSKINDEGQIVADWRASSWGTQLSQIQFNRFKDMISLPSCDETFVESQNQTIYQIILVEKIPDTLKKQILNLIYEILVEHKKINITTLER